MGIPSFDLLISLFLPPPTCAPSLGLNMARAPLVLVTPLGEVLSPQRGVVFWVSVSEEPVFPSGGTQMETEP